MPRNWEDFGITWVTEEVKKNFGTRNASDVRVVGKGPIMVVSDIDKFRNHFGDSVVLGIFDGTSVRVHSQAVIRPLLTKNRLHDIEDMKSQVYDRIRGARGVARQTIVVEKIVVKRSLPDGTIYEGTSVIEYRAAFVAAMVDLGVDATSAIEKAAILSVEGLEEDEETSEDE